MSKLMAFIQDTNSERELHPKARYWRELLETGRAATIECTFVRRREPLGFGPARLIVGALDASGAQVMPPDDVGWDPELDADLVRLGARAISLANETERTGMVFGSRFSELEAEYGSGWFDAVLVQEVREIFAGEPLVEEKLRSINGYRPSMDTDRYPRAIRDIDAVVQGRAHALASMLRYTPEQARGILDGGMAYFLDEKFMISSRASLGLD